MARFLFAAAAALALVAAQPARACPDCKSCPHHQVGAAGGKDAQKPAPCACQGADAKDCKCPAKCDCPHCQGTKAPKPDEKKAG